MIMYIKIHQCIYSRLFIIYNVHVYKYHDIEFCITLIKELLNCKCNLYYLITFNTFFHNIRENLLILTDCRLHHVIKEQVFAKSTLSLSCSQFSVAFDYHNIELNCSFVGLKV